MQITPIAYIRTPFKQKFAVPRQPGLATAAKGELVFTQEFADINCLRGIDAFSHLWLTFCFHQNLDRGWSPLVRPPRLGGNQKHGVFATRSSFRPNGLGQSLVTFERIEQQGPNLSIWVGGVDLVDSTPIFDIKPYLPYVDAIPNARGGFADQKPHPKLEIVFADTAKSQLQIASKRHSDIGTLITQVLAQDPRPAYQRTDHERVYGVYLYDLDVRFKVAASVCTVLSIEKIRE